MSSITTLKGDPGDPIELDYAEFTSTVSPTATSEAAANTIVTGNAVTYDGSTEVEIEFWAIAARPGTTAGQELRVCLFEDGASIGQIGYFVTPASATDNKPATLRRKRTPTAGSHTYSIRAFVSGGTGAVSAGVGGLGNAVPGYIRITVDAGRGPKGDQGIQGDQGPAYDPGLYAAAALYAYDNLI